MVVSFTITRINYLVVSLFCDMVLPLSYVYWPAIYICGIKLFGLRLSCFCDFTQSMATHYVASSFFPA